MTRSTQILHRAAATRGSAFPKTAPDPYTRVRAVVRASLEDADGMRCVDILQSGTEFAWRECRRDPEDGHGWRVTAAPRAGFASIDHAREDAVETVGWLQ